MGKKDKNIQVEMTEKQIGQLEPLRKKAIKDGKLHGPGVVMAQVWWFNDGRVILAANFVSNETASKILDIVGEDPR